MKALCALLALGLLTGGCASDISSVQNDLASKYAEAQEEREELGTIVRADLKEALRSATFHGDEVAATCWAAWLKELDRAGEDGFFTDPSKGVISTFQKARNTRRILTDETSINIRIACAALKDETLGTFSSILRLIR